MSDQEIRNEELVAEEEERVVLTDEDGNDVEFEFCASVEYNGAEYVVLLPVEDEDGEVVILEVQEDDADSEEAVYVSVEDEDVLENVFNLFKEQTADLYDFED